MVHKKEVECYIPLTIERKLKAYSECQDHIERHEVLWHEWNHNKRWLIQVQQLILPSFPSYSRHDVSHSEAVLHNIEMILGEENINNLSATDCFVLLHTVYIHDIGMCITHEDKVNILKDGKFHEYLEQLAQSGSTDMGYYAKILLQECFRREPSKTEEDKRYILNKKLEVYYAITYLIAEYRRKEHGDVSGDRLLKWIDKPDKLGVGFSTIELPNRLFHIIANCAAAHTKWDFEEVMKLKQEDSGFVLDYVHPRFIAVLLQLGDALDMDNDRFHPLTKEYLGKIPEMSVRHYGKHKSIKRLRINNQKISINANCETQDELRLVRTECDGIQEILKNATFYWSVIKPKDSNMCLPTIDRTELLLNGNQIPAELVKAQFEISQEKAFELIKGNNIYIDEHFVFLRELLQNAVDATKIQYFRDCKRRLQRININEEDAFANPISIGKIIKPTEYPIDIELSMKKCSGNDYEDITDEDLKNPENQLANYECGVLVKITDYATGISEEDIKQIANVGSSYNSKREEIKTMPIWLQPTGTFGIGLQSVFLSGKVLKATTCTQNGSSFEIMFHPRQEGEPGYINVTPRKVNDFTEPCGSCFEIFVPYFKKKLHKDSPETWDGTDPFEDDYEESKPIRHTRELIKQMALYIGDMVGEALFPINLIIRDCDDRNPDEKYEESFFKQFTNVSVSVYLKYHIKYEKNEPQMFTNVTWAYNLENSKDIHVDDKKDIYRIDCETAKLYIWNQKCSAYACIGINRILDMREKLKNIDVEEGVKIYYKGIQVTNTSFDEDANMIEYIDLKKTLSKKYLKLNRKGFSQEGYAYLEIVYHEIVKTARNALQYFGTIETKEDEPSYLDQIVENLKKKLNNKEMLKAENLILSSTALVYFAMVHENELFCSDDSPKCTDKWNSFLEKIIEIYYEYSGEYFKDSTLYNMPVWRQEVTQGIFEADNKVSVMEIIMSEKKYGVISVRDDRSRQWMHYLFESEKFHESIKKHLVELRGKTEISDRNELIQKIDNKTETILTAKYSDNNKLNFSQVHKEQLILKWILKNIPTIALFASADGNRRINLLDVEINDSVYYDRNMKKLTIERILESSNKIKRFSTTVWSGYELLCIQEPRQSIQFVKRGKISKMSYGEMIFPLTGLQLRELLNKTYNDLELQIKKIYQCIVSDIMERIVSLQNVDEVQLRGRYWGKVSNDLKIDTDNSDISKSEDSISIEFTEDEYCTIVEGICAANEKAEALWNDKMVPAFKRLKTLWNLYEEKCNEGRIDLWKEAYKKYCKDNTQYQNLLNYVQKHVKMSLSLNQIDSLYKKYMCEIQEAIINVKYKHFTEELVNMGPVSAWEEFILVIKNYS